MNKIKKDLRRMLLEGSEDTYDYGCVMLKLDFSKSVWDKVQAMIEDDDVYSEDGDVGYGREDESHITLLYGLHSDIPDSDIEDVINGIKPLSITISKIDIFENDKFDVVKFSFIGETDKYLSELNSKFTKLPHTTDYPDYKAHSTISYVKSGSGKKYIKTLKPGEIETQGPSIEVIYSKADGSKKLYKIKK